MVATEFNSQVDLRGYGRLPERRYCTACQAERMFRTVLRYKVLLIAVLFGVISERRYYFACSFCNGGWELEKSTIKVPLSKIPLPFLYKYGLFIGLCIMFLVVLYQALVRL